ncbi:HindVP family restriction endonuclease, partial [Escherichia coli]|nr:HindVP family restriction endonuclease [Escherichia coli]
MSKIESLYGLKNTNRKESDLWGKNQFNSSFPTSLACYM